MYKQITLFEESKDSPADLKVARSGSFVDNMSLPIHRWYRYSAGFASEWVDQVLHDWDIKASDIILDPFVGSGTVPVVCDSLGFTSIGVDAHPMVARICTAKMMWTISVECLSKFARSVMEKANKLQPKTSFYPSLIQRSFNTEILEELDSLKESWLSLQDGTQESELVWLAITAILRTTSKAGTAQWQYIQPNKTKKKVLPAFLAFKRQINTMKSDMLWMQYRAKESRAQIISGDARSLSSFINKEINAVITSPPYANNYDYADALRFEMTFWGDVSDWGGIHDAVRKYLIVSSSQHSSRERLKADEILASEVIKPIQEELIQVVQKLAIVREEHGGKKHYHTMVAAYCRDIGLVLHQLRKVCKDGSRMCWVIGDSAPYGVYCAIEKWIGELAINAGFKNYSFEKMRDRNIKWKNRKHRVPLKEGLLWIEG
jgi:hypothetical protein